MVEGRGGEGERGDVNEVSSRGRFCIDGVKWGLRACYRFFLQIRNAPNGRNSPNAPRSSCRS